MTEEFRAGIAKRLRILRLTLGHETAASFARAIGYPPGKYSRYERVAFTQSGPLVRLVKAIEGAGLGRVSLDWLAAGDLSRQPPSVAGARVVSFPGSKTGEVRS